MRVTQAGVSRLAPLAAGAGNIAVTAPSHSESAEECLSGEWKPTIHSGDDHSLDPVVHRVPCPETAASRFRFRLNPVGTRSTRVPFFPQPEGVWSASLPILFFAPSRLGGLALRMFYDLPHPGQAHSLTRPTATLPSDGLGTRERESFAASRNVVSLRLPDARLCRDPRTPRTLRNFWIAARLPPLSLRSAPRSGRTPRA